MPLVSSVGFRIGLREGVLFRSAASLQLAASVDVVAFDKTRTLTTGVLSVVQAHYLFDGAECVVPALVKASGHPVAQAVSRHFSGATSEPALHLGDIDEVAGRGLVASLGGLRLRGGSPAYTESTNEMFVQSVKDAQLTLFTVSIANQLIAVFGLADAPRPDAAALIRELHGLGKAVRIFSGDTPNTVHQLASELGIPLEHAHADCLPSTKEKLIVECQAQGKRVMYVGDGTNDAPALARADVAVAVAAGTDIAQSAASVLLLGSPETASLRRGVMSTLGVARTMRWTAFLCLGWAVAYNILAVLLASGVMVRVRIEPRWAGLGELASVVPVLVGAFSAFAVRKWQRSVKDL
jgi:Cu2+-exporting ATPase